MPRIAPCTGLAARAVALLCLACAAHAQEPAAAPTDPIFEATTRDGSQIRGRVGGFEFRPDGSGLLSLLGEPPRSLAISDLVALQRADAADAPTSISPNAAYIALPEGDRVLASVTSGNPNALELGPGVISDIPVQLPLDRVLGVVFPAATRSPDFLSRVRHLRDPARQGETLALSNGDTQTGSFAGLDTNLLRFDAGNGEAKIERDRALALGFDPALIAYPKPKAPFLELGLLDGSRFGVTDCRLDRGTLSGNSRMGLKFAIAWKNVAYVHVMSGEIVYLTSRQPAAAQFVAYLDHHPKSIGLDSTWDGSPIHLAGRAVERGLGMLPRTLAAYRIEPGDSVFQASVGLDDRSGDQANVVFRVLVDRKEIFASPPMSQGDAPIPVNINLKGGQLLVLVVEFGERGDVQDSAIWANARIIRDPASPRP